MSKIENTFSWSKMSDKELDDIINPLKQDIQNLKNKDNEITNSLNTKQNKIINGDDCGINGNNQIYILPKWKDKINTIENKQDKLSQSQLNNINNIPNLATKQELETKQNKLQSNNNIIVNSDNTLSIKPDVFNGYATLEQINNIAKYGTLDLYPINEGQIVDRGTHKVMMFQCIIPNGNETDFYNNLPEIIRNERMSNIYSIQYNVKEYGSDNVIYSNIDLYIKAGVYQNRLYLARTSASSTHWDGKSLIMKVVYA